MTIAALAQFSYTSIKFTQNLDDFQNNFICEQNGHNLSNPCSGSGAVNDTYTLVKLLPFVLGNMFPFVNLLYIVNIHELKKFWTKVHGLWSTNITPTGRTFALTYLR